MIESVLHDHLAPSVEAIGHDATASAIQAWVAVENEVVLDVALGVTSFEAPSPVATVTPFDLASVTKVFTATAAMIAVDEGLVTLDTPAPDLGGAIKLLQLLNHSSGLPAWDRFYERMPMNPDPATARHTKAAVRREIVESERQPPGVRGVYSDLGYLYLGFWLEDLFEASLDLVVRKRITDPLGLESIRYVNLLAGDPPVQSAASTEVDELRGGPVTGTVHDENCHIIGGVAGHAGLFGTATDVGTFGQHLLQVSRGAEGIVSAEVLRHCWSEQARGGDGHFLGGWDTPSGELSSAGRGFSAGRTVGHLGFTGTSLWIERRSGTVAVLLTNRVYPSRENPRIKALRVAFHEAVIPPA